MMKDQHDLGRNESSSFGTSTASMNQKDEVLSAIPMSVDLDFFIEGRYLIEDAETEATADPTESSPPVAAPTRMPTTASKPTRGQSTPTSTHPTKSSNSSSFPTHSPKFTEEPTASPAASQSSNMQAYAVIALLAVGLIVALVFWRFCKAWKLRRERHMLRVQSTRVDAVLGDMQMVTNEYDDDDPELL